MEAWVLHERQSLDELLARIMRGAAVGGGGGGGGEAEGGDEEEQWGPSGPSQGCWHVQSVDVLFDAFRGAVVGWQRMRLPSPLARAFSPRLALHLEEVCLP